MAKKTVQIEEPKDTTPDTAPKHAPDLEPHPPSYSQVVRHLKVIPRELRRTSNVMTLAEYTEVVGIRAANIETDPGHLFVSTDGCSNPIEIAEKEIREKKCPHTVIRTVGDSVEVWDVNEMVAP